MFVALAMCVPDRHLGGQVSGRDQRAFWDTDVAPRTVSHSVHPVDRHRAALAAAAAALMLAVAASLAWLFVPTGRYVSGSVDSAGQVEVTSGSTTLVESEGAGVIALLAIPVVVFGLALAVASYPQRRRVWIWVASTTTVGALVTGFSIGLFYLPAVALLWVAVALERSGPTRSTRTDVRAR